MFIFSPLFLFICVSARHVSTSPKITSWEEAREFSQIRSAFNSAPSLCRYDDHDNTHVHFKSLLVCRTNSMELRCDADEEVMYKIASNQTVSASEISDICRAQKKNKQEHTENCEENIMVTHANLICDVDQHAKEVNALTSFALETDRLLPTRLERIKTGKGLSDENKWDLIRSSLRYDPRYLWAVYRIRENEWNAHL